MQINFPSRAMLAIGTALATLSALPGAARSAEDPLAHFVPPPLSTLAAQRYATHPSDYARLLAQMAHRPADSTIQNGRRYVTDAGGIWQVVKKAPVAGMCNPLLLTDGTVMVASCDTPKWYKLTPDSAGNYADGTWSELASLPVVDGKQYAPQYHASGVLPDGRVLIVGGEYDGSGKGVWTNAGSIYDPVADAWTAVEPPANAPANSIGDSQSVILADGTFMLGLCCAYNPDMDAFFKPKTLGWANAHAPRYGGAYQDEQGYELLPNGDVLTLDIWTNYPNADANNAERYDPGRKRWLNAGTTPVSLVDPLQCGNFEIGPAVLRGDGSVVAFGGNTGCVTGATDDPTALYMTKGGSWSSGPNVPSVCGSDGATSCDLADAPAALLPNGNILFAASAGYGGQPTHFFEFGTDNTITQVSDPVDNSEGSGAYYYNFLDLPNGQVLSTDFSKIMEVYTPKGGAMPGLAPKILNVSDSLTPGATYKLTGEQLAGRSQGAYYGDDAQMATNYPIVAITNTATGDVFYGRTTRISSYSVAPHALSQASFTLPAGIETGASSLRVIANGIASKPVAVTVQ
ncbi:MAG TPA: hypothetical protein VMB71_04660 [Acetobacteraceae bacterium]|nr:hypothetical protein [Acetobacteraceae bacterium]